MIGHILESSFKWDDGYFLFCLIMLANIIIIIAAIREARKNNKNDNTPSTT